MSLGVSELSGGLLSFAAFAGWVQLLPGEVTLAWGDTWPASGAGGGPGNRSQHLVDVPSPGASPPRSELRGAASPIHLAGWLLGRPAARRRVAKQGADGVFVTARPVLGSREVAG